MNSKAQAAHITVFPKSAAQIKYFFDKAKQSPLKGDLALLGQNKLQNNRLTQKAIQHALKKVADGSAYQWHHKKYRLMGHVKPTTTYFNARGQLCRHIQFSLYAGSIKRKSQALACRNEAGLWIVKG